MRFPRQFLFQVRSRSFFASVIFLPLFVCLLVHFKFCCDSGDQSGVDMSIADIAPPQVRD